MSTRLTKRQIPMVESKSLSLAFSTAKVQEQISAYLADALKKKGYEAVSPSVLNFLSTLECGVNYGSEIARNMGISRQMVAKTVGELIRIGYLEHQQGSGKQKQILFTERGERLMSDSRQLLLDLDRFLARNLGAATLQNTLESLDVIFKYVSKKTTS